MNTDENSISITPHLLPASRRKKPARTLYTGRAINLCLGLLIVTGILLQLPAWADSSLHTPALTSPEHRQKHLLTQETNTAVVATPKRANFKDEQASLPARNTANWVVDSGDNLGMPFMIVDKAQARVLMFDANGQLIGAASALLGMAVGDESVPGIGTRKLSTIRPEERTTPAGRFVASLGLSLKGEDILWVDYENAISLHRVATGNVKERRAERLASPHLIDKRISYGCINVPVLFFDTVVIPAFSGTNGIVYTLPETRPNQTAFSSYYSVD